MVMVFKHEGSASADDEVDPVQGIADTYRQLWRITRLPAVMSLIGILLTSKVTLAYAHRRSCELLSFFGFT